MRQLYLLVIFLQSGRNDVFETVILIKNYPVASIEKNETTGWVVRCLSGIGDLLKI
jgi:hypothetical protein